MADKDHFVRFEKVDKSYDGKVLVVKGLDLDIAKGEFITMLGPSGSGKTTCLMMLAGFETATNGKIYLDNNEISNIPPHKRGIGMVFQNYALFPHMTVQQNISFGLKMRNKGKKETFIKTQNVLKLIRLEKYGDRMPHQLSGGQQQRVALARALAIEPSILLLDEPSLGLSPKLQKETFNIIKNLRNDGISLLIVAQNAKKAIEMADRTYLLEDGHIVLKGDKTILKHKKIKNVYLGGRY